VWKQIETLKHHTDMIMAFTILRNMQIDLTIFRLLKSGNATKQCAFATTDWAYDTSHLPLCNIERDFAQYGLTIERFTDV
jgi:hypothetical protein